MRILVMAHLAPPKHCAGAEMMLFSLLRPLAGRGHQVDVILSRPTEDTDPYDADGITVHPYVGKSDPQEWVPKSDLVVSHLENTPRAVVLSRMARKPCVLLCHNTHITTRSWVVDDVVQVFNSDWMAAELGQHLGPAATTMVVRPPVAAADYRVRPGHKVTLVNLYREKGADVFWELARRMPDVEFQGVIGAYGHQIVHDLPNVTVIDHTPDMRPVYRRTRVLLMPSRYESWGRVGVEAMCSGIPVLANPTPGLRESLGAAGTFVDVNDLDGWERELRQLLEPGSWKAQSALATARAAQLDPTDDINRWVTAVEGLAR